jgi:hypothetical protein
VRCPTENATSGSEALSREKLLKDLQEVKNLFARGSFLGISFHGLHLGMERFLVIRLEELSVAN